MNTPYIPLEFYFCRNPGLAIPLIAFSTYGKPEYIKQQTMDYETMFIDELFNQQYKEIYEITNQHEYVKVYNYPKINIDFNNNLL